MPQPQEEYEEEFEEEESVGANAVGLPHLHEEVGRDDDSEEERRVKEEHDTQALTLA